MPETQFDIDAARKAGYSDDEILDHLTASRKFDIAGAVKAGYSKAEIIDHLSSTAPAATTPPPTSSSTPIADTFKTLLRPVTSLVSNAADVATGVGKEFMGGVPLTAAKAIGIVPPTTTKEDIGVAQKGMAQQAGGILERVGEFALPGTVAGKLGLASGVLKSAAADAIGSGAVSLLHGDDTRQALTNALLSGGLTAAGGLALKGLNTAGQRLELAAVKPLKAEIEDVRGAVPGQEGRKLVSDIYKYGLGGSLEKTLVKSDAKLDQLESSLQSILGQSKSNVDLYGAVNDAALALEQPSVMAKNALRNKAITAALLEHLDAIDSLSKAGVAPNGAADLLIANQVKRGISQRGSWMNGFADPDNEAKQIVANEVYKQLRKRIEAAAGTAGPQIAEINRQMGDILPIQNAVIRRIPVSQRREILSLKEFIGAATGGSAGVGLSLLDRVLRSPTAANAMVKAATSSGVQSLPSTLGKVMISLPKQDQE